MRKILSFLMVALFSATMFAANSYWFVSSLDDWASSTAMTVSTKGNYEYYAVAKQTNSVFFKIQLANGVWDGALGRFNTTPGFNGTDLTDMATSDNAWDGDNAAIYYTGGAFYIIVYKPNTDFNESSNPVICASTTLPSEALDYTVVGSATELFGTAWDVDNNDNNMTIKDGLYTWSETNVTLPATTVLFKIVKNHAYANGAWPESNYELPIAKSGKYDVTITFNSSTKAITATATLKKEEIVLPVIAFVSKQYNKENATADILENAVDSLSASKTIHIDSIGDYDFKIVKDGHWLSLNGEGDTKYTFHRKYTAAANITGEDLRNMVLRADNVGDYVIKWVYAKDSLHITYPAAPDTTTLYFVNTQKEWTGDIYAHAYVNETPYAEWPGTKMTDTKNTVWEKKIFSVKVPDTFKDIIFNNGNSGTGNQTATEQWAKAKPYYCDGEWYANTTSIPEIEPAKYYITGNEALVGELKEWNAQAVKVTADSYTFEGLETGKEYQLKVIPTGNWDHPNFGFGNLTDIANGLYSDKDGNICFEMKAAGDVTITFKKTDDKVTEYTVTGNFVTPGTKTLQFVPWKWATGKAKIAAIVKGAKMQGETWTSFMTAKSEGNDTLKIEISEWADSVKFVRFAPEATEPSWSQPNWNNIGFALIDNVGLTYTIKDWWAGTWESYQPSYVITGTGDSYGKDVVLTNAANKLTASGKIELTAGNYNFFVVLDNASWLRKKNGTESFVLHRGYPGVAGVTDWEGESMQLTVDKAGEYTFTWTFGNDSLGIAFPNLISSAITYAAPANGTLTVKNGETPVATNTDVAEGTVLTIEAGASAGYYLTGVKAYKTGDKETVVTITDNKITMPTYEVTIEATVAEEFYSIAGDISLMGSDWDLTDANNKMTKQSDGSYKLVKEKVELPASASTVYQYKLGHNGAYLLPADGNYQLTNIKRSGEYTLTFTYKNNAVTLDTVCTTPKSIVSKIYIGGDFTNWNENPIELAVGEYELTASKKIALTEGVHEFKVLAPTWKGKAATEIKRPAKDSAVIDMSTETTEDNIKLYVDVAGDYNFIWTYATSKLTIVYPEAPAVKPAWLFIGYVDGEGEHWQPIQVMTKAGNGKTASIALDLEEKEYQLKMIVDSKWVTKNDGDNMYGLKRDWPGVADVKDAEGKNMKLTADWPGEYTFTWTYQNDSLGITFPAEPAITYNLAGNFTSAGEAWDEMKEMTNDEGVWSIAIDLAAKTDYVFKIVRKQGDKKEWYGLENTSYMVYGNCTDWVIGDGGANIGLTTTTDYSYTFKFVPEGMKLSVTIPKETTAIEGVEAGEKAVKVMMNGQLIILKDGKMYNVMGALIR